MQVLNRKKSISYNPQALGIHEDKVHVTLLSSEKSVDIYSISVPDECTGEKLCIQWKVKAIGIKGAWTSNNILDKRYRTDWEMPQLKSSISVDAPIVSLFGHNDENMVTVGCADLINLIDIEASLREEDNHFYFKFHFFTESHSGPYETKLYINKENQNFSQVVQRCSEWAVAQNHFEVRVTPDMATVPLYSTWYSFHQSLALDELKNECRLAKDLGYDLVIIDDGWQTMDDGRGYDYTGDWKAERITDMRGLVDDIHQLGMGIMLWYSVPFCGIKSKAYQRFRGKFLTENHHWAPVFDPRFPEVRAYLVDLYRNALTEWNLDGFKLDFIDDFKVYPETETEKLEGRDTRSVAQGTKKLIEEIATALTAIKPDVLIEFRQQYINPSLRQLGNMFRAFDCPNDNLMNRVRTTDVKLLCGSNAVHSDMLTWHAEEPVEVAALQFSSILFSVPQLSVRIANRSAMEIAMIKFYTTYWKANKHILLAGNFSAHKPLSNYSYLKSELDDKLILGLYDDVLLPLNLDYNEIHIINGKLSKNVVLDLSGTERKWKRRIVNCVGDTLIEDIVTLPPAPYHMEAPANGIIFLTR